MKKIASFTINHNTLMPGVYISRIDGDITTYDMRFVKPNTPPYLPNPVMHTIEHLFATYARNSKFADNVIYFGPMGCRTGFYMTAWGEDDVKTVIGAVENSLKKVLETEVVPAMNEVQCGNYKLHSLALAKEYAKNALSKGFTDKFMIE